MYKDGFDFFSNLLVNYGIEQAVKIANDYLDTQGHVYGTGYNFFRKNPDEYKFCIELYNATKQVQTK